MSTIVNNGKFITVTNDSGNVRDFNKDDCKFSVRGGGEYFVMQDNSGKYEGLRYENVTAPVSSDVYDLRNQVTAMFP